MAESARQLVTDFPKREEPYQVLLSLVSDGPVDVARTTAQSMVSTNVPESVREAAQSLLSRLDRMGKPVDVQFTSLDGQKIDLTAMHGKVVLVDFWATWGVPCVADNCSGARWSPLPATLQRIPDVLARHSQRRWHVDFLLCHFPVAHWFALGQILG